MNCVLCNSQAAERVDTRIRNVCDDRVGIYKCSACKVQFLYPRLTDTELANYYDGIYRKEYNSENYYHAESIKDFFYKSLPEAETRVERVRYILNPTDEIVEIGCSCGYFLASIKPFVKLAAGTEWDEGNAGYARQLGFQVLKNIQDYNRTFDKIFLHHVLEHILEPIDFLSNLKGCLNDKYSKVIIEVPNVGDVLLSEYALKEFSDFYYQSAHLWYFNKESLTYVLERAGYKFDIVPIQRYDLSNHIYWLRNRVPGGQGKYDNIITEEVNCAYVSSLKNTWKTDTLLIIATPH